MSDFDSSLNLSIGRTPDGDFLIGKGAAYPMPDLVTLLCELLAQFPQRRAYIFPLPPPPAPA